MNVTKYYAEILGMPTLIKEQFIGSYEQSGLPKLTLTMMERFASKFIVDENGCWKWTKSVDTSGYGRLHIKGKPTSAHRLMYAQIKGDIPKGLEIDHLCRVRNCINPKHLEAVPKSINHLRGNLPKHYAQIRSRNTCSRGHEYTEENSRLYRNSNGIGMYRYCKNCASENYLKRKENEHNRVLWQSA